MPSNKHPGSPKASVTPNAEFAPGVSSEAICDDDARSWSFTIGDLTVSIPIVQGGMGIGVSLSGLASAVANVGAIGVISAAGIGMSEYDGGANFLEANLKALRCEVRKARQQTGGVLGVNVMVALSEYGQYVEAAASEGIDIVFSGAGLPLRLPEYLPPGSNTKLAPIVSSSRAASLLCRKWRDRYGRVPDAFVVEGPLAGGHLGFKPEQIDDPEFRLEKLVPQTVEAVAPFEEAHGRRIPVIAAGGIYTGADMYKFFKLGATAAQLGTRFVVTHECDVSDTFKQSYLDCKEDDVMIINSPVGLPGRAVRSAFTEALMQGQRRPVNCPFRCIITCAASKSPYCIALALENARKGDLANGFAFAGANAYRSTEIVSVKDLVGELMGECRQCRLRELASSGGPAGDRTPCPPRADG